MSKHLAEVHRSRGTAFQVQGPASAYNGSVACTYIAPWENNKFCNGIGAEYIREIWRYGSMEIIRKLV